MPNRKVNKSAEIARYLDKHPNAGPKETAEALHHLKISPAYVSNIKFKLKQNS